MITLFDIMLISLACTLGGICISIGWNYILLKNTQDKWECIPEKVLKSEAFEKVFKRMTYAMSEENLKFRAEWEGKFKSLAKTQELIKTKLEEVEKKLEDIRIFEAKSERNSLNLDCLKENTVFLDYLKSVLEIDLLKTTLLQLNPLALESKSLDDWQQHMLHHFWQLYSLKPEFLPAFKTEILQEIHILHKGEKHTI